MQSNRPARPPSDQAPKVQTVLGPMHPLDFGSTDAHNHCWIESIPGTQPGLPVLDREELITTELTAYRLAGGSAQVDCQPGGCGRDAAALARLSAASGVHIVACTGFHLRKYYPPDAWMYNQSAEDAADYFIGELTEGTRETLENKEPVLAGFIKIACEASLEDTPRALLEAAAQASLSTGAAIEMHTEKGAQAERFLAFFTAQGLSPERLVICHIDKRPDFGLHSELAKAGALLEYDTFFRPRYDPETHLWGLIARMAAAGHAGSVALATDMAETTLWRSYGGDPGLAAFVQVIKPRLEAYNLSATAIHQMMGGNIVWRLSK